MNKEVEMQETYYKQGDEPGNWLICPMGRICREAGKRERQENAQEILGKSSQWMDGYVDAFDGCMAALRNSDYLNGHKIGRNDRKVWLGTERNTKMELKRGERVKVKFHHAEPGEGLSYTGFSGILLEDCVTDTWDVVYVNDDDTHENIAIYAFSL